MSNVLEEWNLIPIRIIMKKTRSEVKKLWRNQPPVHRRAVITYEPAGPRTTPVNKREANEGRNETRQSKQWTNKKRKTDFTLHTHTHCYILGTHSFLCVLSCCVGCFCFFHFSESFIISSRLGLMDWSIDRWITFFHSHLPFFSSVFYPAAYLVAAIAALCSSSTFFF